MNSFSVKFVYTQGHSKSTTAISKEMELPSAQIKSPSYAEMAKKNQNLSSLCVSIENGKSLVNQSSALDGVKQSINSSQVQLNEKVLQEDFNNLWVISRLLEFDDWKEIAEVLEEMFNTKVIINPC